MMARLKMTADLGPDDHPKTATIPMPDGVSLACTKTTAPVVCRSPYYSPGWYFEYITLLGDTEEVGPYSSHEAAQQARARIELDPRS